MATTWWCTTGSPDKIAELEREGAVGSRTLSEFAARLVPPRVAWVMMPAGEVTSAVIAELATLLATDDIVIDGGNSRYTDDVRHAAALRERAIHFVDCGTSGGVWGLERGYCLMIGGEPHIVAHLDPVFRTLAPGAGNIDRTPHRTNLSATAEQGYLHCGPAGAGHFVKMVHNGIGTG